MGKPDPVIYKVALEMLQLPKDKVIAIGDSLQHDIQGSRIRQHRCSTHLAYIDSLRCKSCHIVAHMHVVIVVGACNAGVDSVFITGGIHAKDIAATNGEVDEQKMLELFRQHKGEPTYTMRSLQI